MGFLKIGDRAAGAIKSGGTTRRASVRLLPGQTYRSLMVYRFSVDQAQGEVAGPQAGATPDAGEPAPAEIPAVEGDSGGPVYARWPDGTFTAVGVVNTVHTRPDGTGTGGGTGTLIAADINANEMTLLGVS